MIENGYIKLPKVGLVRPKQHRFIPSNYKLKSVTLSQTPSGEYYISVLFEYENQVQQIEPQTRLGFFYEGVIQRQQRQRTAISEILQTSREEIKA